jgi:two-component system chemotaxis response regulator CheB
LGLAHIKDIGGYTIAQDPASCIIDGMPEAAIAGGCVDDVLTYMGIRQMLVESFDRVCV